jgi:methionyl aminopeptidase
MKIHLKTEEEIEYMRQGGKKLMDAVHELMPQIRPGVTTEWVDARAEELIRKHGAEPSFTTVPGYHWTTCLPVNEQVVHTPPSKRVLKEGDILTVDVGALYKGLHTDWATTVIIGKPLRAEHETFLKVGEEALEKALLKVKGGHHTGEISKAIEDEIYGHGYFILKELTGHGVGKSLHEDPHIPGYCDRPIEKTPCMEAGLTIAVEVIYSLGTEEIAYEDGNDWSVITRDRSLSACFEKTIAVTVNNSFILT